MEAIKPPVQTSETSQDMAADDAWYEARLAKERQANTDFLVKLEAEMAARAQRPAVAEARQQPPKEVEDVFIVYGGLRGLLKHGLKRGVEKFKAGFSDPSEFNWALYAAHGGVESREPAAKPNIAA